MIDTSTNEISTAEVESALVSHAAVAEAAVVGANDDTTGQAIVAFVILRENADISPDTVENIRSHVGTEIGSIAKPKRVMVVKELPKTRSGKIMRRLLRDVAENRDLGDTSTLADPAVMALISSGLATATDTD